MGVKGPADLISATGAGGSNGKAAGTCRMDFVPPPGGNHGRERIVVAADKASKRPANRRKRSLRLARGFYSFTSVTLIKNRLAGVMWNIFIASAMADFSSDASTVPMRLPR
jgi:hypothetical protein